MGWNQTILLVVLLSLGIYSTYFLYNEFSNLFSPRFAFIAITLLMISNLIFNEDDK